MSDYNPQIQYPKQSELTKAVQKDDWMHVYNLRDSRFTPVQWNWAIREGIQRCNDSCLEIILEDHWPESFSDQILTELASRDRWKHVFFVLSKQRESQGRGRWAVSEEKRNWVLSRAVRVHKMNCDSDCSNMCAYFATCSSEIFQTFFPRMVARGMWCVAVLVLESRRYITKTQRRWVLRKACAQASATFLVKHVLPICPDEVVRSLVATCVEQDAWGELDTVLQHCATDRRGTITDSMRDWALQEVCKKVSGHCFTFYFLSHFQVRKGHMDSFLETLVARGNEIEVEILEEVAKVGVSDEAYLWLLREICNRPGGSQELLSLSCVCPAKQTCRLLIQVGLMMCDFPVFLHRFVHNLQWDETLTELVTASLQHLAKIKEAASNYGGSSSSDTSAQTHQVWSEIFSTVQSQNFLKKDNTLTDEAVTKLKHLLEQIKEGSSIERSLVPCFASFLTKFEVHRKGKLSDRILIIIFSVLPIFVDIQSHALQIKLREKRWDIFRLADMRHVWEQVRRQAFQAAVKQKQWRVVEKWADQTLYEDQRYWAMEAAIQEKQWKVCLLLADFGMMQCELACVHFLLAKKAQWRVVLQTFEHGASVYESKEFLWEAIQDKQKGRGQQNLDLTKATERFEKLQKLHAKVLRQDRKTLASLLKNCRWRNVLWRLQQTKPSEKDLSMILGKAISNKAWHVVIQVLKLGIGKDERRVLFPSKDERNALFSAMVKQGQWGVCRVLLEQGVSTETCVAALPEMINMSQWVLVATVMEYDVGDYLKHEVMQCAVIRREGSVVWQCIKNMRQNLTAEEREDLFQQAFAFCDWQALKPLVEVKDDDGIRHRDKTMWEALVRRQWDMVDHCQRFHADINVKDDKGNTFVHKFAMQCDWEALEEVVQRDGEQYTLDSEGSSALHRAIAAGKKDTVKLLIQFHGSIHLKNKEEVTPLEMLIDQGYAELIDLSLIWHPDVDKGVTKNGETPLHAVCEVGRCQTIYFLVARGVDPFALTIAGESALMYAVQNVQHPQAVLAECIKMGFSNKQPQLNEKTSCTETKKSSEKYGSLRFEMQAFQQLKGSDPMNTNDPTLFPCGFESGNLRATMSGFNVGNLSNDSESYLFDVYKLREYNLSDDDECDQDNLSGDDSFVEYDLFGEKKCDEGNLFGDYECDEGNLFDDGVEEDEEFEQMGSQEDENTESGEHVFTPSDIHCEYTDHDSDDDEKTQFGDVEVNLWRRSIQTPLQFAFVCDMPIVLSMLYHSGSSSNSEAFELYKDSKRLLRNARNSCFAHMRAFATTPRSLESLCRLVISSSLTCTKRRLKDVHKLPVPELTKQYIGFSDLTDPDYGKDGVF